MKKAVEKNHPYQMKLKELISAGTTSSLESLSKGTTYYSARYRPLSKIGNKTDLGKDYV